MTKEHHSERLELAGRLRELREAAGLSTTRLATMLGWSQSKVSKIENGRTRPAAPDAEAWLSAVAAPADERARLVAMAEAIRVASVIFDHSLPGGGRAGYQRVVGRRADRATTVRTFTNAVVPGLFQTAEYARRVLGLADIGQLGDTGRAAAARMERQVALYDEGRQFDFLVTESALRFRPAGTPVLLAQYDKVLSLLTLPTVSFAVLPNTAEASALHLHGFVIYELPEDVPFVTIETYSRVLTFTDPQEVAMYQRVYELILGDSLQGEDARQFLLRLRDEVVQS